MLTSRICVKPTSVKLDLTRTYRTSRRLHAPACETKSNPNYCQPRSRQPLETCVYADRQNESKLGFLTEADSVGLLYAIVGIRVGDRAFPVAAARLCTVFHIARHCSPLSLHLPLRITSLLTFLSRFLTLLSFVQCRRSDSSFRTL